MTNLDSLKRAVQYDLWANRAVVEAVAELDPVPPRILSIVSHIVAAQQLWLDRLHGDEQSMAVWPDLDMNDIRLKLTELGSMWTLLMENQRDEKLLRPVAYTNSKGIPWANRVEEIVHHACIHSAYHRGQIAMLLRDAGVEPPLTDFIHAVRTGQIR